MMNTTVLETSDAALATGARLRFVQQGLPGAPAILLLHGLTDSWYSFSRMLPLLPRSVHAIVPDQRGHGGSGVPERFTMDAFALDALDLLDRLQIERATIVGHSLGSFVARRLAALAPSRIDRLVLLGTGSSTRNAVISALHDEVDRLTDPVDAAFVRAFQTGTIHRPVPPDFLDRVIADSCRVPARVWKGALAGMMDFSDELEDLRVPALILGGDRDSVFTVAEQTAAARRLPGAALQIFSDVGHALHWEDPFSVTAELMAFLNTH